MPTAALDHWIRLARSRVADGAAYAGELLPEEAWQLLEAEPAARLIDVRTPEEWRSVGVPQPPRGAEPMWLPWRSADGSANAEFFATLGREAADAPLLFLCRVGGRSWEAAQAATERGFELAFNVTHGFEGDPDETGRRGARNGWKAAGLPWIVAP